jgi:hypothetical protein
MLRKNVYNVNDVVPEAARRAKRTAWKCHIVSRISDDL